MRELTRYAVFLALLTTGCAPAFDDPDPMARYRAVEGLWDWQVRRRFDEVAALATDDPDVMVRIEAADALIRIREPRAAPVLAEIFDGADKFETSDPILLNRAGRGLAVPAIDPECANLRRIAEHHPDRSVRTMAFTVGNDAPHCEMAVRPDAYKLPYP